MIFANHIDNKNQQVINQNEIHNFNESMEKTKNQNHNAKKESLGPNTKR